MPILAVSPLQMVLFVAAFRAGGALTVLYPIYASTFIWAAIMGQIIYNQPIRPVHVLGMVLLIVGMFMDIISATMILGPVFLPMLDAFGINWMHFGLIMTVNLAIGYCTPPMGVSLYITGAIANRDLIYVSKAVMPFIAIQILVLLLMTFFPDVVLWLPRLTGRL